MVAAVNMQGTMSVRSPSTEDSPEASHTKHGDQKGLEPSGQHDHIPGSPLSKDVARSVAMSLKNAPQLGKGYFLEEEELVQLDFIEEEEIVEEFVLEKPALAARKTSMGKEDEVIMSSQTGKHRELPTISESPLKLQQSPHPGGGTGEDMIKDTRHSSGLELQAMAESALAPRHPHSPHSQQHGKRRPNKQSIAESTSESQPPLPHTPIKEERTPRKQPPSASTHESPKGQTANAMRQKSNHPHTSSDSTAETSQQESTGIQSVTLSDRKEEMSTYSNDVGDSYWMPNAAVKDERVYRTELQIPVMKARSGSSVYSRPTKSTTSPYWQVVRDRYLPSAESAANPEDDTDSTSLVPSVTTPSTTSAARSIQSSGIFDFDQSWVPFKAAVVAATRREVKPPPTADETSVSDDSWVPAASKPKDQPATTDVDLEDQEQGSSPTSGRDKNKGGSPTQPHVSRAAPNSIVEAGPSPKALWAFFVFMFVVVSLVGAGVVLALLLWDNAPWNRSG